MRLLQEGTARSWIGVKYEQKNSIHEWFDNSQKHQLTGMILTVRRYMVPAGECDVVPVYEASALGNLPQ